jgi:hypothetical protein
MNILCYESFEAFSDFKISEVYGGFFWRSNFILVGSFTTLNQRYTQIFEKDICHCGIDKSEFDSFCRVGNPK